MIKALENTSWPREISRTMVLSRQKLCASALYEDFEHAKRFSEAGFLLNENTLGSNLDCQA